AENDSQQFRLLGEEEFTTEDLQNSGIQLGVQIQGQDGWSKVRFTDFEVRAERLSGPATESQDKLLAELNAQRDQLPISFAHDLSTDAPGEQDFHRWTDSRPWEADAGGLSIKAPGTDNWTSAGFSVRRSFHGDFDVTINFQSPQLATPKPGKHSQVYLQVELSDTDQTQLSCVLTRTHDDNLICQGQIRTPTDNGYDYRRLGSIAVRQPDYLRLARRGGDIHYIAGTTDRSEEYLIGSTTAAKVPIGIYGVRLLLHTGGDGRTSQVLVKSIEVRSAITGNSGIGELRPEKPLPQRLLQSIRDIF
ncbi:MAG: DUF1583 domain-containing protein, partial [Pirellulales bacterium]|nr:DUF1583 domain-containing protein [Pirellulales bacterium]